MNKIAKIGKEDAALASSLVFIKSSYDRLVDNIYQKFSRNSDIAVHDAIAECNYIYEQLQAIIFKLDRIKR